MNFPIVKWRVSSVSLIDLDEKTTDIMAVTHYAIVLSE